MPCDIGALVSEESLETLMRSLVLILLILTNQILERLAWMAEGAVRENFMSTPNPPGRMQYPAGGVFSFRGCLLVSVR